MNINKANQLTILRFILIIPFIIFLELSYWQTIMPSTGIIIMKVIFRILALAVFVIAVLTDYYDGKIARETNTVTDFGKLMDPIADKLLTFSYIIVLLDRNLVSVIFVLILFIREILITYVRVYAATNNGKIIPAISTGKYKTIALYVGLLIIGFIPQIPIISKIICNILLLPAIVLSIISAYQYIVASEILKNKGE